MLADISTQSVDHYKVWSESMQLNTVSLIYADISVFLYLFLHLLPIVNVLTYFYYYGGRGLT
jgi:hypothetical protein